MKVTLALPVLGIVLAGLYAWNFSYGNSLTVPHDSELGSLYGGACGLKVEIACGANAPPDSGCVYTECFAVTATCYRKHDTVANCGVATCGTVNTVIFCGGIPP